MSKFKDRINKELRYIKCDNSANDIIEQSSKKSRVITFQKIAAVAACIAILFTVILIPSDKNSSKNNSGFTIVANAQSSSEDNAKGDVLNTENFVVLNSEKDNLLQYNFSYVLDENAHPSEISKKYLFHSFSKRLDIKIEGENIETITYKIHNGTLGCVSLTGENDHKLISNCGASYGKDKSEFTVNYNEQKYLDYGFSPIGDPDWDYKDYCILLNTGEFATETITTNDPSYIAGIGYKDDNTLATEEEIETLRKYAKKDDMVGFYNYQNQIFKRLIDGITLDVTVTKTDGSKETQTVEFLYTPDILKEIEYDNRTNPQSAFFDNMLTQSTGTLSARIKK